jgi:hypothetical protein
MAWVEHHDIISDAQFGFRSSLGTVDAIFALQTVIDKYLSSKKRYTAVLSTFNVRLIQDVEQKFYVRYSGQAF